MDQQLYDFGMIGLGVMGRNFLLNVADDGFGALGTDIDGEKVAALNEEGEAMRVKGVATQEEFVHLLAKPRKIMLLVPAGKIVDKVIEGLLPKLDEGDIIIDGGNSHYDDTNRRYRELKEKGFRFLGTGVSGGAKGARLGPSIMPGGDRSAWQEVKPILETVAAKVNGEPCVTYIGERSSGHYVKMVHNGIEYGLMQLIAEAYDVLKGIGGLSNTEIGKYFEQWNEGKLASYLIEITATILQTEDELVPGQDLIDAILDKAKQKGTGKWTSQTAMDLGIPIPTIDAAVTMRGISSFKAFRTEASPLFKNDSKHEQTLDGDAIAIEMEKALYFGFINCYAQGMHLLAEASKELDYDLDLEGIARIWRGGCIIRAELLELIRQAYSKSGISNMIVCEEFREDLTAGRAAVVEILHLASERSISSLCLSSSLHYFDAFVSARLPLNIVQAQRDFFGSHTYERLDREGTFHTEWE